MFHVELYYRVHPTSLRISSIDGTDPVPKPEADAITHPLQVIYLDLILYEWFEIFFVAPSGSGMN
jgi:hypothetical protein